MTTVLGINPESEGFSAAVVRDGLPVAAIEQFKIRQHWLSKDLAPLPTDAIRTSLAAAGLEFSDIDVLAFIGDVSSAEKIIPHIRRLDSNGRARIEPVDSRLAHSAVAFYSSPFDRASIVLLGGGHDTRSICVAAGVGSRIEIEETPSPHSAIGELYHRISNALGFHVRTFNKVAWFGAGGEPEFLDVFRQFLSGHTSSSGFEELVKTLNFERPQNIAASLQVWTNESVIRLVEDCCARLKMSNVCIAGDLAENPFLIRALEEHFRPHDVFVPPAPGREGLSIGAAFVHFRREAQASRKSQFVFPALGPEFSDSEIKSELDNCKLVCSFFSGADALVESACNTLVEGGLVGWFQGRCEFGHRALGFRSILANPFTPYIDENINRFLKHRETFHPFVISVAEEFASEYFDQIGPNARTIASVYAVKAAKTSLLSTFTIHGRYVRVHTVSSSDNHLFWMLLQNMQKLTGHPLLINSSFNLPSEPLVLTPRDAIRTFYASGLDVLAIGRFLLSK
jgi:carbamoyltransferase